GLVCDNRQSRKRDPFGVTTSRIQAHVSHSEGVMLFHLSSERGGPARTAAPRTPRPLAPRRRTTTTASLPPDRRRGQPRSSGRRPPPGTAPEAGSAPGLWPAPGTERP